MAERTDPDVLVVGHVSKPHGIRGEVYVQPLTDHPEGTFAPGVVLRPALPDGRRPDPGAPPLRVEAARPYRRGWLVHFAGVRDRTDAERIRGRYLVRPLSELEPLAADELFYHQLVGLRVATTDGTPVGTVQEVYELQPSDLLEVRTDRGTLLVPYRREIVVEVDAEAGTLVIEPPDGLLDL